MTLPLPFSQASENNKQAILDILGRYLKTGDSVLEIAGGTGQHAVFFAEQFPNLKWQSSDIASNVDSLNLRLEAAQLKNLPVAIALDVNQSSWGDIESNVIFSANSLHIMSKNSVENFFSGVGRLLPANGLLLVYGPCKYGGEFTTESNARFDQWLRQRNSHSGVRDFEWLNQLALVVGLELLEDCAMPANNQLLVWRVTPA